MIKNKIIVPKGIRYINEWKEFSLPNEVCIIDKQITGCGFTEYCLTNQDNVILCSPRKILLENKAEQKTRASSTTSLSSLTFSPGAAASACWSPALPLPSEAFFQSLSAMTRISSPLNLPEATSASATGRSSPPRSRRLPPPAGS